MWFCLILDFGCFFFAVRFDLTKHCLPVCPKRDKLSLLKFKVIAIWLLSKSRSRQVLCYPNSKKPCFVQFKKHTDIIIMEVYFHELPRPLFCQVINTSYEQKMTSSLIYFLERGRILQGLQYCSHFIVVIGKRNVWGVLLFKSSKARMFKRPVLRSLKSGKRPGPLIHVNNDQLRAISEAIVISAFHDKHRQDSTRALSLEAELELAKTHFFRSKVTIIVKCKYFICLFASLTNSWRLIVLLPVRYPKDRNCRILKGSIPWSG